MRKRESKCIDTAMMLHRVLAYAKGHKLIDIDQIVCYHNRENLVWMNMNRYFGCKVRLHNKVPRLELNLLKRRDWENFEND